MLKPCRDCGSATEYVKRRTTLCRPCKTKRHREYCQRTGYHKARYAQVADQERERHLVRKYSVTLADYERMFVAQGGACAICRKIQDRVLDVDHDHTCGTVRGLLCTNCNRMLGHAHDSIEKLKSAVVYLQAFMDVAGLE